MREHLIQERKNNNKYSNENIPKKLLNELASLSNLQFRVEIKSKNQLLVLPSLSNNSNDSKKQKLFNDTDKEMNSDANNNNILGDSKSHNMPENSPLENDYVILKCEIINRNLVLVPPIRIFVPYNYPDANSFVDCIQLDDFDDDMLPDYSNHSQ